MVERQAHDVAYVAWTWSCPGGDSRLAACGTFTVCCYSFSDRVCEARADLPRNCCGPSVGAPGMQQLRQPTPAYFVLLLPTAAFNTCLCPALGLLPVCPEQVLRPSRLTHIPRSNRSRSLHPDPIMAGFDFSNHNRNAALHAQGVPLPKATSTGTTIVGCLFDGGVVIAADTRATSGPIVADKVCNRHVARVVVSDQCLMIIFCRIVRSFTTSLPRSGALELVRPPTPNSPRLSYPPISSCMLSRPAANLGW